jgi:hypothetical protein
MMHFSAFDIANFTIFLISFLVFIQKPTPMYLKLFPVYFFCALVVLFRSEWLSRHGKYNTGLANVWGIIEFCFYYFVLHEVIANNRAKRIILYIAALFASFAFFNIIFIQHKVGFNPINFTIGCLITVSVCIYYFVELFQKSEAHSLSRLPAFWVSSGILFNTVLTFPTFALEYFLEESTKVDRATLLLYRNIDRILLIVVVLTFILYMIGFICRIRIRKSTI